MVETSPGYQANRARISLALSQFTVPLLSRIYHAFDGDMVAAIVLGEIAHRNVERWLADQGNPEQPLHDPVLRKGLMRPCNALSIAEACGLPRETVRRKVVALIERGYIYRDEQGLLYLTTTVGENFEDVTRRNVEALLETAHRVSELLADRKVPIGPLRLD